jgi:hypothetical protein
MIRRFLFGALVGAIAWCPIAMVWTIIEISSATPRVGPWHLAKCRDVERAGETRQQCVVVDDRPSMITITYFDGDPWRRTFPSAGGAP